MIASARTAATTAVTAEFGEKGQADADKVEALTEKARREARQV